MKTVGISGGTATFREQSELRGRDRRLIQAAVVAATPALAMLPPEAQAPAPGESDAAFIARREAALATVRLTRAEADTLLDAKEAVAVAMLASWTRPEPLPTMDTIGDLPADLYDQLVDAMGGVPASAFGTNFEPEAGPDGQIDPQSPTLASRPSSPRSPDALEAPSTAPPPSDGVSIATASSSAA